MPFHGSYNRPSGNRAPQLAGPENDVDPTVFHTLAPQEFWEAFERRYGKNPDLQSEAVREFVLPRLLPDFELVETYVPAGENPVLPMPLAALGAKADNRYTPEQISAWEACCEGGFEARWFEGGHKYLLEDPGELLEYLAADMAAVSPKSSGTLSRP
mmetsp:Transcript_12842/g.40605  ORF Transcript_12842/g.40605 Transcript_12842/m.40605 type:complete len:157 (-) Transcript_12842:216-686(-)